MHDEIIIGGIGFLGTLIAVITPIIKLNSSITKLNVTIDNMSKLLDEDKIILKDHEKMLDNHETRLQLLELTFMNKMTPEFQTIFIVIISFYFGTQAEKLANKLSGEK